MSRGIERTLLGCLQDLLLPSIAELASSLTPRPRLRVGSVAPSASSTSFGYSTRYYSFVRRVPASTGNEGKDSQPTKKNTPEGVQVRTHPYESRSQSILRDFLKRETKTKRDPDSEAGRAQSDSIGIIGGEARRVHSSSSWAELKERHLAATPNETFKKPVPRYPLHSRMRSYISPITCPTADTPGTLFYIHFDDRRYLVGNLSEGSTRALTETNASLRKVTDVFLTGRTRWSNVGGLLGTILEMADTKASAVQSSKLIAAQRSQNGSHQTSKPVTAPGKINIYGAPNLNHLLATARRFIFRRGLPIKAIEFGSNDHAVKDAVDIEPSHVDDRLQVWALPAVPDTQASTEVDTTPAPPPQSPNRSRKRSYDEVRGGHSNRRDSPTRRDKETLNEDEENDTLRKNVVQQMFNSSWRFDRLVETNLRDVRMPATCYLRDPDTKQLVIYSGPKPGSRDTIPNITVLVREPWPSSQIATLPPTKPSSESISYIFKHHEQRGRFQPEKAKELKIPRERFAELTAGNTIKLDNGTVVTPDMVLNPAKPGAACAIIAIPDVTYIQSLIERPEWMSAKATERMETMFWNIGPGVGADPRIAEFQSRFPDAQHFVASTDYTENEVALCGAATNSLRHNFVDAAIFPRVEAVPLGSTRKAEQLKADLPLSTVLQRGQRITLEPKVDIDSSDMQDPFDAKTLDAKIESEWSRFPQLVQQRDEADKLDQKQEGDWEQSIDGFGGVETIVLGTGSSHPSKYRNVSGTLVRIPGWGSLLLDAGEGTMNTLQRMFPQDQLRHILKDLRLVWISHLHADHHLGLTSVIKAWNEVRVESSQPSMMDDDEEQQTFWGESGALLRPQEKLAVIGDAAMSSWLHEYSTVEDLSPSHLFTVASYPPPSSVLHIAEPQSTRLSLYHSQNGVCDAMTAKNVLSALGLETLNTTFVDHCHGAQAVAMKFSNGFKLSYSGDCRPNALFSQLGRGSHLLVHEATFEDDMRLEAIAKKHSTAGEALIVAAEMEAKVCLLTHFSQRYPTMPPLGVNVGAGGQEQRLELGNVLEVPDGAQPDTRQPEETDSAEQTPTMKPSRVTGAPAGAKADDRTAEHLEASKLALDKRKSNMMFSSMSREAEREEWHRKRGIKIDEAQVIDQSDLQRLIDQTGLKVVFAFDYMRLRLADVPRLLLKQPILRQMYDLGIGKDLIAQSEGQGDDADPEGKSKKEATGGAMEGVVGEKSESARQRKKRENRAKNEKLHEQAKERKRVKAEKIEMEDADNNPAESRAQQEDVQMEDGDKAVAA